MKNLTPVAAQKINAEKSILYNFSREKMKRTCGICSQDFLASSKYSLFCKSCKAHNERYKYAEWMSA